MIQKFKHPLLTSKAPIMVHVDFVPSMDLFCRYLGISKCTFYVTSSGRMDLEHIHGAIVVPAVKGNHLVFHAFDGNVIDSKGVLWTSEMMKVFSPEMPQYNPKLTNEVSVLINLVRNGKTLRWGGDFHPDRKGNTDPVHWDDALNIKNPKRWEEIYKEIHKVV